MMSELADMDSGLLLRYLYLHNENMHTELEDAEEDGSSSSVEARQVILSQDIHSLNENCVGRWAGPPSSSTLGTLFLGGPGGDTEFRRVGLIPRCVSLHIPFVTMQIDADVVADAAVNRAWGQELGWLQSDRILAHAFHMGYACEETVYTPMAEILWLIGARHPHVYTIEFPDDIGQAVQCFSNEEGSKNLCGSTIDSCTPRHRAKEAYTLVQTAFEKYASEFSATRAYRFMDGGQESFNEHFLPRFPTISADGPRSRSSDAMPCRSGRSRQSDRTIRPGAAIEWAQCILDMKFETDLGYLLRLVFVNSVVKSCGGTSSETQDAVFEPKIDMRALRTEICNVQMMVRGWEHDDGLDTAHVKLMVRLVDLLMM